MTKQQARQLEEGQKLAEAVEAIYAAYPKKVARPAGEKAIQKAIKGGADPVELLKLTQRYARIREAEGQKGKRYTLNPATWYNQRRYEDDPSTWGNAPEPEPENEDDDDATDGRIKEPWEY